MSIIIPPIDPSNLLGEPQHTRTFADELAELMSREDLLLGIGRVGSQTRTPNHPLVTPESEEWKLLQRAARTAYKQTMEFMGPEFCETLCEWLRSVKEIYLYKPVSANRTRTGLTITGLYHPPVLHLVLSRDTDRPYSNLENARILKHETMHIREYVHPIRLTRLERQIKAQFLKCHKRGLTDQTTRNAIKQPSREQIPWAMEALTLGVDQTMADAWRKPRPAMVKLIQQHKPQIAGWEPTKQIRSRKLAIHPTQQETTMTTQPANILTNTQPDTATDTEHEYRNECVRHQQGDTTIIACYRTPSAGGYPTHPLSRGVLRWLKTQAQKSLDTPQSQWNGCYPHYQQLRQGTHPDPNPGKIITPNNPDSFKPEQIDVSHELPLIEMETDPILSKTLLIIEDYPLYLLEPTVIDIDRTAWFTIETERKQKVTSELYAQTCLKLLEEELKSHEYGRRIKEDPEYARQIEKQIEGINGYPPSNSEWQKLGETLF